MIIKSYKTIKSTSLVAKKLVKKGTKPWTIVLAKEQTSGYGRKKTFWFSPKGGLYFSIILPKSNIEDLQTLTILAAFSIGKIIKESFSLEPFIKLPNDLYINQKKFCGILTENVILGKEVKSSVMGIGLNTNIEKFPDELKEKVTSLKIELGRKVDNEKVLKQILKGVKEQLKIISQ